MKIKMRTMSCGPGGNRTPGQVLTVSEEEARQLADGGFAEIIFDVAPVDVAPEIETAALAGAPEMALSRRGRKK